MEPSFKRRELADLLDSLDHPDRQGVFVLGDAGSGKTVLLRQVEAELLRRGRAVFLADLSHASDVDLATLILSEISRGRSDILDDEPTIRASGGWSLGATATLLNRVALGLQRPVLLLDALDESQYPQRTAAAVEELGQALDRWKLVVASRPVPGVEARRFYRFDVLQLGTLTRADALALLRELAPDLADDDAQAVIALANGNPLALHLAAHTAEGRVAAQGELPVRLEDVIARALEEALSDSSDHTRLGTFLEELALAGGRDRISALAGKLRMPEDELRELLGHSQALGLLTVDEQAGTVAFVHILIQKTVLSRRVFLRPFRLTELRFGAEEAERDDLLDASFVGRDSLNRILGQQRRSIVIGDRGSGKSAIFRKLAEELSVAAVPVANTGDLLHRIVDKDAWLDADALRAAWLVVIAAVVASSLPSTAPKALRRDATDLQAALALPTESLGRIRRAVGAATRILGGATLKFGVGPMNFETKLPTGTRPRRSFLDVGSFLQETDQLLRQVGRRVVVLLDRIDETFKYDRERQQALVQALLQAEARVSQLHSIELVLFLRTDLFELYDVQEKNKLVSRSLALEWSEEDWLRVLIRRVFANEPLARLAHRLQVDGEGIETRAALEVLFPAEIEGQPVDRWLVDSLRNGNGDISPRLAVLLLHLTRERSARPDRLVSAVPLFSADEVQRGMTNLSDLSFSELVNDFKVAPTFVLNCRAGKLVSFALPEVEQLFDGAEGRTSEQVRLLERLGFLERVVEQRDTQTRSLFRIPRLYTRCWDFA